MKRNDHPDFVGIDQLKQKQAWQLEQFEQWADHANWMDFHANHYDWWMFPYDEPSSQGFRWTVYETEVLELKQDSGFVKNYLRGVELLLLSWGWQLQEQHLVEQPGINQDWADWPIRLYKCSRSLKLFGYQSEFESTKKYAQSLLKEGVSFSYNGRDLAVLYQ